MAVWTDFTKMAEDIVTYAQRTGAQIVVDDNPTERQLGFMAVFGDEAPSEESQWLIAVTDLLKTLPHIPEQNDTVRMLLRSAEGRAKMASGFTRGLKVWE